MYGNVVDWRTAEWQLWNMTLIENVSYNTICNSRIPGTTIFPTPRDMHSALAMCRKFRGTVSVIKDTQKMAEMSEKFLKHVDKCRGPGTNNAYWNGWWDEPTEKQFTNVNDGSLIDENFQPW